MGKKENAIETLGQGGEGSKPPGAWCGSDILSGCFVQELDSIKYSFRNQFYIKYIESLFMVTVAT